MAKFISTKAHEIDAIPGSIRVDNYTQSKVSCIEWDRELCTVHPNYDTFTQKNNLHWLNIIGTRDKETIQSLGQFYNIHPLTIEDIHNNEHPPKFEETEDYNFIVIKMLRLDSDIIIAEQLNIIYTNTYVITVQEYEDDIFDSIRDRLVNKLGRVRDMGCDYLVFSILDTIVDHYILTVEKLGETVETFEDEIFLSYDANIVRFIRKMKQDFTDIRRFTHPVISIIEQMHKLIHHPISEKTLPFFRDLRDQIRNVSNAVSGYRELLNDQLNLYAALQSNRMNEIMKVLAIISTIFIPLSFIAGVYGMNFVHMPELQLGFAYPLVLLAMITTGLCMGVFFRMKGWIGKNISKRDKPRSHEKRQGIKH